MSIVADLLVVVGAALGALAGLGLLRFRSTSARFHAAGKASPVAFLAAASGAALSLGWPDAGPVLVAMVGVVCTVPVGVHLLFRAAHRGGDVGDSGGPTQVA